MDSVRARTVESIGRKAGRPRTLPDEVVRRIVLLRKVGLGFHAVARQLNADGVPTAQPPGRWHGPTVREVLVSRGLHSGSPRGVRHPRLGIRAITERRP